MITLVALIIILAILAASSFIAWWTMPEPHVDWDELVARWKEGTPIC